MDEEKARLGQPGWKTWGPYVSDRQWGTVREDYSAGGDAWNYITHDMARSKAYRWGEDGIAGICDDQQYICFALALWNKHDPIIKERYFGLSNPEGNHGEDVKELYYYLDSTPTHSYMKMLYKYPQLAYPYQQLLEENKRRDRSQHEFELIDTGIFNDNRYFDVYVEYAKAAAEDILICITVCNRGLHEAALNVLPTVWFRNTWSWGRHKNVPTIKQESGGVLALHHNTLGEYWLITEDKPEWLFCDNVTNNERLYQSPGTSPYPKDGINDHLVYGTNTVNPAQSGTKAAANYDLTIPAGQSRTIKLRFGKNTSGFADFDEVFAERKKEADGFYTSLQTVADADSAMIQRQAFAGMLWNKQFYDFNVYQWLTGDPAQPAPPPARATMRNKHWQHLSAREVISMPDKWEYPWFAAWDLAFHCIALAAVDMNLAKEQLILLTREWYMHPDGQLPAYEWEFDDTNPPVQAMAAWKIYEMDKGNNGGRGDLVFLETVLHKLMLNFTWWVNRKDSAGNNVFEGGFLGLDNIGVFDRNAPLPTGGYIEQADGTSWMAMYALNLMRMATELSFSNRTYEEIALKFFDHFMYIAGSLSNMGEKSAGLWDDDDGFFYDQIRFPDGGTQKLRVRSVVGLIPLLAVEVLNADEVKNSPIFNERFKWFYNNRPDIAAQISHLNQQNANGDHLVSLLRGYRMKTLIRHMADEASFLSGHGIRSVSKYHLQNPYSINVQGKAYTVKYLPAESDTALFGGNSNWRGPVWIPINYLLIDSLRKFYSYYGDDFKVEFPTGSGKFIGLNQVADQLCERLTGIFKKDAQNNRPVFGDNPKLQTDPFFAGNMQFHEYFDGDTGKGLGASHQTGWTGLIALCFGYKS